MGRMHTHRHGKSHSIRPATLRVPSWIKLSPKEIEELEPFVDDELILFDDLRITVTPLGRDFVRNIAMTFDAYLRAKKHQDVAFSRTV